MQSKTLKRTSLFIALLVAFSMVFVMTIQPAQAAKKYSLPVKITNYRYKCGKFTKVSYSKLYYNKKGHLIKVKHSDDTSSKLKISYYKTGKLKKITCPDSSYFSFGTNGRMTKHAYKDIRQTATYKGKRLVKYKDGDAYKYRYTYYSNGRIKTIEEGFYGNANDVEPEAKLTLNKKGFVTGESSNGGPTFKLTYSYDKKGRVKTVTEYCKGKKSDRYVFSYGKARAKNRSKYTAVINAHVYPGGSAGMQIALTGGYGDAVTYILPTY